MEDFVYVFAAVCSICGGIAAVVLYRKKHEKVGCLAQAGIGFGAYMVCMIVFAGLIELNKTPAQRALEKLEEDSIARAEKMQHEEEARQDSIAQFQKEQQELINEIEQTAIHAIKDNMNDDDSFDFVDDRITIHDTYWEVWVKYRGNNQFGAKMLGESTVRIDKSTKQVVSINNQ